ncbi:MAG: NADH:flavin oxidoreductase, partial [Bacillota bacterium]
MPGLFTPIELRDRNVRNRIVMPPMATEYATEEGEVTEEHLAHYRERANSEVGIIIVEHTFVRPDGRASERQLSIEDDSKVRGLSRLAKTIREGG